MHAIAQDLGHSLRGLARSRGFAVVAILTLALGIGGTTTIFGLVDGLMLRDLPYPNADRIVVVGTDDGTGDTGSFAPADYLEVARSVTSFAAMAGYRQDFFDMSGSGDAERLTGLQVTAGFFDVFGRQALVGRTFTAGTDRFDVARVAVISEGVWRRRFGARPDVVGTDVRFNGVPTTILGVVDASVRHPVAADVWLLAPEAVPTAPVTVTGPLEEVRDIQYFRVVARLAPDRSIDDARAEMAGIAHRLGEAFPRTNGSRSFVATELKADLVGDRQTALVALFGAMAALLLIACANVASLLLARGATRRRELAVRAALGASRGRLLGYLLAEAGVLAAAGGALGVLLALWGLSLVAAHGPAGLVRLPEVHFDARAAAFALACTAFVAALFGTAPALQGATAAAAESLKDGGRTATARGTRLRSALVAAEIGLALVLLIGAGLLLTSFLRLRAVDLGFETTNVVAIHVPLPQSRYSTEAQARFYTDLATRVGRQPLVEHAAIAFPFPMTRSDAASDYEVVGRPPTSAAERRVANLNAVSPGYFATVGIPLLKGRDISDADGPTTPPVVIVNEALARREWPNENPLGAHLVIGEDPTDASAWATVVGVVADSRRASPRTAPGPAMYFPMTQFTLPFMGIVVRSPAGPTAVASIVKAAVADLDPDLPIGDVRTLDQLVERATGEPRMQAVLVTLFAGVALTLAIVGIYGLISYTVAERVPEIGMRIALGATPVQVRRLVIGSGLRLAATGVVLGLAAALAVLRLLDSLLYGISATNPLVYAGLALLVLGIATLACWIPARRAMRVDPLTALRCP